MQLRSTAIAVAAIVLLAACQDVDSPAAPAPLLKQTAAAQKTSDRHLVVFRAEAPAPANFAERVAALGGKVVSTRSTGIAVVSGLSASAAAKLRTQPDISDVESDVLISIAPMGRMSDVGADVLGVGTMSPTNPAGAVRHPWQWNLKHIGMPGVWSSTRPNRFGSSAVRVAILDTGFDPNHADTQGIVDMALSKSFVPKGHDVIVGGVDTVLEDDDIIDFWRPLGGVFANPPEWIDLHGHGTHVANTVASNAVRLAGMTSQTKIIAVKVLDVDGSGFSSEVLEGLAYASSDAVDAHVINMSLGSLFLKRQNQGFHRFLNRATKDATNRGSLVVVAAGNSGINMDHAIDLYNAYCSSKNVVCVSATGPSVGDPNTAIGREVFPAGTNFDELAFFSNFGRHEIDVAAPGGNYNPNTIDPVLGVTQGGFVWQACSQNIFISIAPTPPAGEEPPPRKLSDYIPFGCGPINVLGFVGTSQAAPHVSGLAALLAADMGNNNPEALRERILNTADDLGRPGRDPSYGYGRINPARALGIIP